MTSERRHPDESQLPSGAPVNHHHVTITRPGRPVELELTALLPPD